MTSDAMKNTIEEFIKRGEEIKKAEYHSGSSGFPFPYVSGPKYNAWMNEIKIFSDRHLKVHPLYESIQSTYSKHQRNTAAFDDMMGYLKALINDEELFSEMNDEEKSTNKELSNRVFVVHGHDEAAKQEVARILGKLDFNPIILHEQPDNGRTIIEKIENYADVGFAVILYTECDVGRDKNLSSEKNRFRARQNVVFEHGYFIAKLGRSHVFALVKGDVETPGDISGVIYTPMDASGAWEMRLAIDMKAVGLPVDMNKLAEG